LNAPRNPAVTEQTAFCFTDKNAVNECYRTHITTSSSQTNPDKPHIGIRFVLYETDLLYFSYKYSMTS